MLTLVRRARRRLFGNELLAQGVLACSVALAAVILLLLLGTEILDWRWVLLVSVLAGGYALYRARKRLPSEYAAAQIVDHRMALADTISTALYFSQESHSSQTPPALRQFQLERAGRMSEAVDVRQAVPYLMPRAVYVLGVVALVAASLFALRYGLTRSLDLKAPLANMMRQQFSVQEKKDLAKNMGRQPQAPPDGTDDDIAGADSEPHPNAEPDLTSDAATDGTSEEQTEKSGASKDGKRDGNSSQSSEADQEAQAESSPQSSKNDSGAPQSGNKQDQKQAGSKQETANQGESSSLMNKAKDMFQNLLSSLKPPQSNPSNQQQNKDPNNQKGQQNSKQQQNEKSGEQQNGGQQGDAQDGQQSDQAQSPQDPQDKGNGKSDSPQASKQPGTGIGNQDGDKRIKQAEDLAAMGKITELLGKRSANITGEATVEVQSTSQQLRTAYSQRNAQHVQGGAEINRDEIPVSMQPYVQQYFEQVRKQAPAPAAAKK